MPKNLKRLIRERRGKTGESHQTAARHVRGKILVPSFESLVRRIIKLVMARNAKDEAEPLSDDNLFEEALARARNPLPCARTLTETLRALPERDLQKLKVLMYSGRDDINVHSVRRTLPQTTHDVTVLVILEKAPAYLYLEAGLRRAKKDGVDLDGDF